MAPRILIGLAVLALGALMALENFGFMPRVHWSDYWPLILIVLGVANLLKPRRHRTGGFVLLGLGAWFLARNLWYPDLDFRQIFPFFLVFVGICMVFGAFGRGRRRERCEAGMLRSAVLHPFAILGSARAASNAQDFRGGSATALLGSCTLDLREADIALGDEALIDATAIWGGVLVFVPETWTVVLEGMPVLGAFQDSTRPPAAGGTRRLVVRGVAMMGGVEIRNRPEREDQP